MNEARKQRIEQAAVACTAVSLTDEELANAIEIGEEVLVYLRARGPCWALATNPMILDLEALYGFQRAREEHRKRYETP